MVRPGLFLVPGCTLPLAPGFARYTPALGFFPGPPGVGFPLPALAQEWGRMGESTFSEGAEGIWGEAGLLSRFRH